MLLPEAPLSTIGATLAGITDDLYRSHEDALSETISDKIHRWYDSAHKSRLEKKCPEIDIGTRWSKTDVIGSNIEKGYYDRSVIISAIGPDGRTFCEDVKSTEDYEEIRDSVDLFIWESEYQQNPIQLEGVVFDSSKFQ